MIISPLAPVGCVQLVIPTDRDPSCPPDLPRSISVQTSEMVATNTRHPANCTRSHLEALLQAFQEEPFFSSSFVSFPRSSSSFPLLHPVFQHHAHEQDTRFHDIYRGLVLPTLGVNDLKMPAAADFWAMHFAQFWVDYEGTRGGKGRPQPFVDSFPLSVWACQPAKILQHQEKLRDGAGPTLSRSTSVEAVGRLQRKRLLKEYYSTESAPTSSHSTGSTPPPSNGLHKPLPLDSLPSCSSASSSRDADVHVLVHVQKHLSAQVRCFFDDFPLEICFPAGFVCQSPAEPLCASAPCTQVMCVFPGEPSSVCVPDASAAQHQSSAADFTAGPGGDGLQEGA